MTYRPAFLAAALLALAPLSPALAEATPETALRTTPVPAPLDWSGVYFGAAVSTPRGDNAWASRDLALSLVPGDWTGNAMMLTLGHDWQRGRMTYGALLSGAMGTFSAAPTSATYINCDICATEVSDLMTLRGRMGVVVGSVHVYATGGLARGYATATNLSGLLIVRQQTLHGWTAGVGVEHRIGDGLSLALSYDHVDLGTMELPSYVPSGHTDVNFGVMSVGMTVRW